MDLRFRSIKAILSISLAVTVTTLFTLRAYATVENKVPASTNVAAAPAIGGELVTGQNCTGTLTVKSGGVTLNGNPAQTGATIMTGSVVATGDNGSVIIDLGALGRIELGHHSTATINCAGGVIQVLTNCGGKVHIESHNGNVEVKSPKSETIAAGKGESFDGPVEFTAGSGASVSVECGGASHTGGLIGPGVLGLLALVGVGAAVAAGITVGSGDTSSSSRPPVSGA